MNYVSVREISENWNLSEKTIKEYCMKKIITDFKIKDGEYLIGKNVLKPAVKRGRKKDIKFKFIDLFCGIGGFHQAMSKLGGDCVFACDINEKCQEVYLMNYNRDKRFTLEGDIIKAIVEKKIPEFDVLCGGFPCQTFSKAGKRNGFDVVETENGEKDERGQLFFRIIDILKEHPECKYVILENVRNLADNKENWRIVCDELKQLGFIITEDPIIESPHHFGIPQVRDRVYILGVKEVAIKTGQLREERKITRQMLGIEAHYERCPKNCIPMLLDEFTDPKYYLSSELTEVLDIWEEFLQNVKGVKSPFWLHKAGLGIYDDEEYKFDPEIGYQDMPDWKKELVWKSRVMYNNNHTFIDDWAKRHKMTERSLIHQKFEWNASRDCKSIKDGITQFRQSGVRVKNPDYFPSLVAMNNTPIVWDAVAEKYRYLSPHEAAKLQSFKDDFMFNESDTVSYRQLGNSVNVKLVRMFAEALLKL
ncbi:MAG: DNA (cytosine-5-)-methyltransferase [Clostridia bacterium]|nr:DNA (cytosine-5-)-methyltransferase [Clostridia bacterium]